MPDVLELARFRPSDGQEEAMLASRPAFLEAAMEHFDGLKSVHLVKLDDGTYVDVAVWETREQCQLAAESCMNHPAVADFLSHCGEELGIETGEIVDGAERAARAAA